MAHDYLLQALDAREMDRAGNLAVLPLRRLAQATRPAPPTLCIDKVIEWSYETG
jgi:hypothetical protein